MSITLNDNVEKIGFWKRLWMFFEAMDASLDRSEDAYLFELVSAQNKRIKGLEAKLNKCEK